MNLETARQHILNCRERMDALYQKPVFDEWVIISIDGGEAVILAYLGLRADSFKETLHTDSAPIVREMQDNEYAVGDFEFAQEARGSRFDACVRLGQKTYLFCNNTYGTLADIRQDPRWIKAQVPFVDFTEKFRADELV